MILKDIKVGQKYKVTGNLAGHNTVGMSITIRQKQGQYVYCLENGASYLPSDLSLFATTKEEIIKEVKELKEEIKLKEEKLVYLEETNSAEYSENEFKAYTTLKLLDNKKLSQIEKARVIAKLIEG